MQPDSASSASPVSVETRTASGVSLAQIGYSARSQPKSDASWAAGTARVSVWYRW